MIGMHKVTSSPLFGAVVGAIVALGLYQVYKISAILFALLVLSPLLKKSVRASIVSYWNSKKVS